MLPPPPETTTTTTTTTELGIGMYSPLDSFTEPSEFDHSLYTEDVFDFLH